MSNRKVPVRAKYPMVCAYCGAILYGATITPTRCPKCGRPWKEKNPEKFYHPLGMWALKRPSTADAATYARKVGAPFAFRWKGVGSFVSWQKPPKRSDIITIVSNPVHKVKGGWQWGSRNPRLRHSLELHREYIGLQNKPISDMTNRELQVVRTETPSFGELEQAEKELKKRGKITLTGMESFTKVTGGKIISEENPIHHTKEGWQWGHQKIYPTRSGAERQARAIYASGYKGKNPTLVMPVKSRKQLGHLFMAQSELAKGGVTFDTSSSIEKGKPTTREWELDWSLKGAEMKNPSRKPLNQYYCTN